MNSLPLWLDSTKVVTLIFYVVAFVVFIPD